MTRLSLKAAATAFTALLLAGCPSGGNSTMQEATDADVANEESMAAEEEAHGHEHAAPHGGHLIELGEHQYNVEVVFPDSDGNLSVYVLGPHAETPVMVSAEDIEFELEAGDDEVEVELTAVEAVEEKASHFTAPASALGDAKDIEEIEAHLHVTIEGTEFTGGLDHDHGEHEGDDHAEGDHGEEDHGDEEDEKE